MNHQERNVSKQRRKSIKEDIKFGSTQGWGLHNLHPAILHALQTQKWLEPTLIQQAALPILIKGGDAMIHARTGSGKTAAFIIPLLQRCMAQRMNARSLAYSESEASCAFQFVIVVPTTELVLQTIRVLQKLCCHLPHYLNTSRDFGASSNDVRTSAPNLTSDAIQILEISTTGVASLFSPGRQYDFVVSTPAVLHSYLRKEPSCVRAFRKASYVVLDEADAITSLGSMKALRQYYPVACHTVLVCASMSPATIRIKKLYLRKPFLVSLEEEDPTETLSTQPSNKEESAANLTNTDSTVVEQHGHVEEYYIPATTMEDRLVWLYAILRNLASHRQPQKVLIFVRTTAVAYRTKLFLEGFRIQSFVLHGTVPVECREHILQIFNHSPSGQLIVVDQDVHEERMGESLPGSPSPSLTLHRGIDFVNVSHVVMLDTTISTEPRALLAYTHRLGRTGRAGRHGVSLLFLAENEVESCLPRYSEEALRRGTSPLVPYPCVGPADVTPLRYRCEDVLARITRKRVRQALVQDVALEILNCDKLRTHLRSNTQDEETLRHIAEPIAEVTRGSQSLGCVPTYLNARGKFSETIPVLPAVGDATSTGLKAKRKKRSSVGKDPIELVRRKFK